MTKRLRKFSFYKVLSGFTILAMLSMMIAPASVFAASITSAKDTLTRLQISTTADHTVVFTLPTGVDIDRAGNTDTLRVDFPHSSGFTQSGTWVAGDFSFNDGTARTISAVSQGSGTIDCTPGGGANDVCVAIDTTNHIFTIEVGASYTASGTAPTVTFTIDGTTTDGTLTNPSSAGSYSVTTEMCDETASCTSSFTSSHIATMSLGVIDDDTVAVTATVNSSLTFDMDTVTGNSCSTTETAAPYAVAIGTITTTDTRVSGATDTVESICVDLDTNASGGVIVTVHNTNGTNGLVSTSVGADNINSADGAMVDGTENYGLCVVSVSQTTGTLAKAAPYNSGSCAANTETNDIQALTTSGENILTSSTAPIAGGRAQIAVNAAISGVTVAHNDYTDALTFIATATY